MSQVIKEIREFLRALEAKRQLNTLERGHEAIHLAKLILRAAHQVQKADEKQRDTELAKMFDDQAGKSFSTAMHDQCFRSENALRIAQQISYLLAKYGTPKFLDLWTQFQINIFRLSPLFIQVRLIPLIKNILRKKTAKVIFPGEDQRLYGHLNSRAKQGVKSNVNRLGEAILGEQEAERRMQTYLADLKAQKINYMSIKISTLYSQINTLSREQSLEILAERLRRLYRAAQKYVLNGSACFINLDMEEYRDVDMTCEVFKTVLNEEEFWSLRAGIVLQAYLPDSYDLLLDLIAFAKQRIEGGGVPLKLRIVKGANLAMEKLEASHGSSVAAPFEDKLSVDAHYKKMLEFALKKENAVALNIGIASHNLFELAYAFLLMHENAVEQYCEFEMLEGMAPHIHQIIQQLSRKTVLYCPVARETEFNNAIAYLIRRLDEQSAEENFLRHSFKLHEDEASFEQQGQYFLQGLNKLDLISSTSRRNQIPELKKSSVQDSFVNEMNSDFILRENVEHLEKAYADLESELNSKTSLKSLPLIIGGEEVFGARKQLGLMPDTGQAFYQYSLADLQQVEMCLQTAVTEYQRINNDDWLQRSERLLLVAQKLRENRFKFTALMMCEVGKSAREADAEVSEAIDFCEYYARSMLTWQKLKNLSWSGLGTVLVCSPWNFPLAISTGGIAAALVTGNTCIYKPAPESVFVAYELVKIFHQAGFSTKELQFLTCEDEPVGSALVKDDRLNGLVLTGATETAQTFMKMRPTLNLMAETGGKNAMIITELSDRDLAIKHLVDSAFAYAGQKCSACSVVLVHESLYRDEKFLETLKDAAQSRFVGLARNFQSFITPLIKEPRGKLLRAMTHLEKGETWLLEPHIDPQNPHLMSPGIKLGIQANSESFRTEFFGPILSIMSYDKLEDAIELLNSSTYGLTGGIHSLDEREQKLFLAKIEVGNAYVCRGITGAMVQRQAFGGYKNSAFGRGLKAGGPNYLLQFCRISETISPSSAADSVLQPELRSGLEKYLSRDDWCICLHSIKSYERAYEDEFSQPHDYQELLGQANILRYRPLERLHFIVQENDTRLELCQILTALRVARVKQVVVFATSASMESLELSELQKTFAFELCLLEEGNLSQLFQVGDMGRIRVIHQLPKICQDEAAEKFIHLQPMPVYSEGRLELVNYFHSQSLSIDYHRYGNVDQGFSLD
ncbi:proline dehydrogenase family protein [Lentisphaera marina]|uniref:proline dehydrogenase family protein n=1 Tax=Lentisphaera marina TaxID=1111041 RepID=UPI0023659096|nr:proline dehydrogenase family protein [Lentisphaera marina]MDD7985511.1 proline dehydrogenase family protein [Lentisphaera marina]